MSFSSCFALEQQESKAKHCRNVLGQKTRYKIGPLISSHWPEDGWTSISDGKTEQSDSRSEKSLISNEKFPIYFPEPRFAKNHFDQIKANDKFREKILEKGKFKIRSFWIGCQITWAKYRGKRLNVALQYKLNLSGLVVVVNAIN